MSSGVITVRLERVQVLRMILDEAEAAVRDYSKLPRLVRWMCGKTLARTMDRLERKLNVLPKGGQS